MGLIPNLDDFAEIRNGNFDDASEWVLQNANWTISGGLLKMNLFTGAGAFVWQFDIPTTIGYLYRFKITASNTFFGNPADSVAIRIGGVGIDQAIQADGVFTMDYQATEGPTFLQMNARPFRLGNTADFDMAILTPMTTYPAKVLGIKIPGDEKTEVTVSPSGRVSQIMASRDGKTNVGILYDL